MPIERVGKTPGQFLMDAYEAACQTLPAYKHKKSPKKYTQPQLMACLALKKYLGMGFIPFTGYLVAHPDLLLMIGMGCVPHFTTFQKAALREPYSSATA